MSGINLGKMWGSNQGPTGRRFQLRDGSDSGIGTAFFLIGYHQVLKILIGYFWLLPWKGIFFWFNYCSSCLGCWTLVHVWLVQPMCWHCLPANVKILPICIIAGVLSMFSTWGCVHTWYLSFFSPWTQFFSTQKRVNCDKTEFATKQRKLQKKWFWNKKQLKFQISEFRIFSTSQIWRNFKFLHICYMEKSEFSPHQRFEEISNFPTSVMWTNLNFLHMMIGEKFQFWTTHLLAYYFRGWGQICTPPPPPPRVIKEQKSPVQIGLKGEIWNKNTL